MHGISVHGALAIKRQRRRRDAAAKRAANRHKKRTPSATNEFEAARQRYHRRDSILATKVIGTITTFHIGLIFTFVGCMLLMGAVLLKSNNKSNRDVAELVGTGVICILIGSFLLLLNRIYGNRDDDDLKQYVGERLGRSESGGVVYKEEEESDADADGPDGIHIDQGEGNASTQHQQNQNATNAKSKSGLNKFLPGKKSGRKMDNNIEHV